MSKKNNNTGKSLKSLCVALTFLFPVAHGAANNGNSDENTSNDTRVEVNYGQRHSRNIPGQDLYADGIKIKRDLSLIEKVQTDRWMELDEIPADDLYGGVWSNSFVNVYKTVTEVPDTFKLDLSNFSIPTTGHVTSNFGMRKRRMHYGIDLKVQTGDTIYAAFDGKVRLCKYERKGYGYYVVLRHPNGLETVYGHLSKFLVKEDDVVKSGEPIALGGNTGRSTGAHLHFEMRYVGKPINPVHLVDFENKVCHKDEYVITPKTFMYNGKAIAPTQYAATTPSSGSGTPNKYVSGDVSYHRVKKGDTLSKIAKQHGTTVKALCRVNNISEKTILKLGRNLRIP